MGVISSNIPFSEHNQAPRNYFNFAQTRQGMGIYATNHRYRVDLSYLLYHPMRPLVITRAAKYTNELDIPAGEMMMVAIACYTGLRFSPCHNKSYGKFALWRATFSNYGKIL
jgi:DNA-directed RNA polymerase II subunit RPB2